MLRTRVIPVLLVEDGGLVKTRRFRRPTYLGDPINAVRIFNEKEVPELVVVDIGATPAGRGPDLSLVAELASECFVPLCYGGGVTTVHQMGSILGLGVEKVAVNSAAFDQPRLIEEAASLFGSQSVVVSIDVGRNWMGKLRVRSRGGRRREPVDPVAHARAMERAGAGEIILNAVHADGEMAGYDLKLIRSVADAVSVPVVACGGAGSVQHLVEGVEKGGAAAVAAGSMFVFEGPHRAVLISYPDQKKLVAALGPIEATDDTAPSAVL